MVWRVLVRVLGWPLAVRARRAAEPVDAIVVLGAPLRGDGGVGAVLEERVRAGVDLWRQGTASLVIMAGGRTRGAARAESEAMGEAALGLGLPPGALLLESASQSTYENALRVAEILGERGLRRVLVVTTPFHLRRSVRWFRRAGLDAAGWLIVDSVQFSDPRRGLRWVLREYGSWVVSAWIDLRRWLARSG
jgi:uncharacterized SAM-binding protein YcdF (DUF218 family)